MCKTEYYAAPPPSSAAGSHSPKVSSGLSVGIIGQGHGRASECISCGQCEGVCPQHLPIIDLLKDASAKLDA